MLCGNCQRTLSAYHSSKETKKDIIKVKKKYHGLHERTEKFVFPNNSSKNLVKLKGTIPVPFKGKTYNIPVGIWLMDIHPIGAPMCYVEPTPDMCLKPSRNVDSKGKVYLSYLHNWDHNTSNLTKLIKIMITTFSESPPVCNKSKKRESSTQQSSGYHTQANGSAVPGATNSPACPTLTASYTYSPTQTSTANNVQYPGCPPCPPTTTATPVPYPPYPPNSAVTPTYPVQPPSVPASTYHASTILSSTVTFPSNTGTITDEHNRTSLMSAIEDKIRRKINVPTVLCQDEIEIFVQTQRELIQGKNKLDSMFKNLEEEKTSIIKKIQTMNEKRKEMEVTIEKLSVQEEFDVDDAVVTTTPLYKQILNLHCEDAAIEDTIYYIGEALRRGVIDLNVFMKQVRALSRKRLMLKSLLEKCRMKAGLPM